VWLLVEYLIVYVEWDWHVNPAVFLLLIDTSLLYSHGGSQTQNNVDADCWPVREHFCFVDYIVRMILCAVDVNSRPEPEQPVNNNQAFVSVVRTRLNSHSLGISSSFLCHVTVTFHWLTTFHFETYL